MTPPPGWYRDPSAPHQERWWDGTAWTEHRRTPEATGYGPVAGHAQAPPQAPRPEQQAPRPHAPPPQGLPPQGPRPQAYQAHQAWSGRPDAVSPTGGGGSGAGGGRAKAVALTAAAAVLVAAVVAGVVALGGDDGGSPGAQAPPATAGATDPAPVSDPPSSPPGTSAPSADAPAVVEDQLNGVTFPLPDGWERPRHVAEDDVMMTTDGTYKCPADGSVCRHGLVVSRTVTANAESAPEALAREDIADAADDAYDRDLIGNEPFGGIESHEEVASGPVAVAGRAGYYVRWRVRTAEGPGGYVQSMVFPSTVGTESPILVRYVFDAGEDGPPMSDMDTITKGIRPVGDADTGGGVGSGIGPTD
ncbi:DUF2510 domain-containing protein [Streptomyces olivaceus]|uniref:DUF2510 domain-containing protein n=1 Tax=Streptomyces olivaceus TaxID=47716 RepID=UPI001CCB528E|nr:DUF2510 domain-containing protein [Streptomyces olivaceus]MBZ6251207.1 DUF2510 domain-containing protein [Streptomyces olivaceus]